MVCVPEEGHAQCTIRDFTSTARDELRKINLLLPISTTVQELFLKLAEQYQYDPDSFEITLQRQSECVVLNNYKQETIKSIGVNFEQGVQNNFIVTEMHGQQTRKMAVSTSDGCEDDMILGASASPTAGGDYTHTSTSRPSIVDSSGDYYTSAIIKNESVEYVGLVNQAMTCYLNSLLQALFMTPEFRNALYKWEYDAPESDECDEVKSIPYELQKLFLNLQTSTKSAVETTDLTRSFGWDSSAAWQQHDIQELCRVMFDALEQKFKNTEQADLISRLYEGKMLDYVKCLACGTEKSREDTFLDIPLPVRQFGSAVAYSSVEGALSAFVDPETLEGNNQYHCEKCNKKCDAHKGLKFTKFPYLLTLHLKRFDFDATTLHRIKLNDKVIFPQILNLNSFITQAGPVNKEEIEPPIDDIAVKCDDSSTTDSGSALDDESCQGTEAGLSAQENDYQEDDEGIDMGNGANHENEKNRRHTLKNGPYKYELFSIMIHSGSASGGHYYAYIKDFKTNEWFCFNDQSVSRITQADIDKTYGGGPMRGYYSGAYSSSTNAYMLMYRQIDKQRNSNAINVEEFPPHIKALHQKLQAREEFDRKIREREIDKCKFKVFARHPKTNQIVDSKLYCTHNSTLREVTELAYKVLDFEGTVPLNYCRLVNYDGIQNTIECSFEGKDDEPIIDLLNQRNTNKCDLYLEYRKDGETFEVYHPGGVMTKVFVIDVENEKIDGPFSVRANRIQTVGEFKQTLAKVLSLNASKIKIFVEKYKSNFRDEQTLKAEDFYPTSKVYVSTFDDEIDISRIFELIDRFENCITLHFVLPEMDEETLRRLAIPQVDLNHNTNGVVSKNGECGDEEVSMAIGPQPETMARFLPCQPNNIGSLAARETSPQPPLDPEDEGIGSTGHSDQSASEDSSLTDSDRTLVGDVPDECLAQLSTPSNSSSDQQNVSSPEECGNTTAYNSYSKEQTSNCDEEEPYTVELPRPVKHYFRVIASDSDDKVLKVFVDKGVTLRTLKCELRPYVGVPLDYIKIYRTYSGKDTECSLTDSYRDEEKLIIKLERPLRKGECKGKVHLFTPHSPEQSKYLCDWIIGNSALVSDVKKEILHEIKRKYNMDIPFERCRLRKKNYKIPTKVYLDSQRFEGTNQLLPNWEIFLQELTGPEKVTSALQTLLFVRHWCPSTMELKTFEEVVLDNPNVNELKLKLSELSSIPPENIEYAVCRIFFPCEMPVLSVHKDQMWNTSTDAYCLHLKDHENVIFYRDKTEELKELTPEERKEIANREGSRISKISTASTYSPRRERALKIYLDTPPRKRDDNELD